VVVGLVAVGPVRYQDLRFINAAMFCGDESGYDGALVDLGVDGGVCLLAGERAG
jgi:hypothetical protein